MKTEGEDTVFVICQYNQNQEKSNLKNVEKLESYCPLCNASFYPEKASVIDESNTSWLLHTTCSQCASSIVSLMLVGDIGISSFGLLTDLTKEEIEKFRLVETVNEDDLLDLYQLLDKDGFTFNK